MCAEDLISISLVSFVNAVLSRVRRNSVMTTDTIILCKVVLTCMTLNCCCLVIHEDTVSSSVWYKMKEDIVCLIVKGIFLSKHLAIKIFLWQIRFTSYWDARYNKHVLYHVLKCFILWKKLLIQVCRKYLSQPYFAAIIAYGSQCINLYQYFNLFV